MTTTETVRIWITPADLLAALRAVEAGEEASNVLIEVLERRRRATE